MTIKEMNRLINCCHTLGILTVAELKQFKKKCGANSNFDLLCELEKVIKEKNENAD